VRFLFSCIPGEGHFRPLLPLARALRARGHDVAFAVAEEWSPRVADEGFAALAAGIDNAAALAFRPGRAELMAAPPSERRSLLFPRIFGLGHAPAKLPDLLARAREWEPEVVVHDSADLAAPIAAAVAGLPVVNHSFGTMVPLRVSRLAADVVAPLWREQGLEPDLHAGAFRGLYVDLSPPGLARADPPAPSVQLRPVELQSPPPQPPTGVETPFVYATMGTIWNEPELFRILLDALAGLSAVVTVGRGAPLPDDVPSGVRVERFVPQEQVLPYARAVISHGGSGTMLGALAHGLPLVLIPQGADQFDNAALCTAAGVAVVLMPGEADAGAVRHALDRVLAEPSYREAARRLAVEMAALPSADEVARHVEEHARAG
jgi:UDP:flavonoid glycosyltransferase YjiC (YdhE family)